MAVKVVNLKNENRKIIAQKGCFCVVEHEKDLSVSPYNAVTEYYMTKMDVKRKQLLVQLDGTREIITQAGAMQWTSGNVQIVSGIKGAGDLLGKIVKSAVTKESVAKPTYTGKGLLMCEPTYKYIILQDVAQWGSGMCVEDGMFLACEGSVKQSIIARSNVSSAVLGNEGLFNLSLSGNGVVALESNVPESELIEIQLDNDTLKIDGSLAVCWSSGLQFSVERSSKSLIGSAVSGEGLVNVYRGTGKVWLSPVAPTSSLFASTNTVSAKADK